jgi:hypothetical protein
MWLARQHFPKRVREEGSLKTLTLRRNVVTYLWPKLPEAPDDSLKQNRARGSSLDCFAFWAADTEGTRGCRLCRGGRNYGLDSASITVLVVAQS